MLIKQLYTGCLSEAAYYIESNGESAIIDPLRDIEEYLHLASERNTTIRYIFETHFHADFVSGHVDLARKTGATIVFGPNANPTYECKIAADGEVINVGDITFKVLHTPGHTMESTCYLLMDEQGLPHSIYTGDTLFIGDVGRPDLAQKNGELTTDDLAGFLYDSLRNKVMPLPDSLVVYPAHGAGSACGKNMSKETFDLLGNQKQNNYALRADMSKAEFIKELTDGIPPPPAYFSENVRMNKTGYPDLTAVMEKGAKALSADAFEALANETGALLLDTRKPEVFTTGFIPNSISIGIDGGFAPWVGALITDINQPILIIADEGREAEVVKRLARVGYDNAIGFLKGGFEAWKAAGKETDTIVSISAAEFAKAAEQPITILDVRKPGEYNPEHVAGAINMPLDNINQHMHELNKDQTYYVHCAGGYRSMIYASVLKARGFEKLIDVAGGYSAIKHTAVNKETTACSN